MLRRKRLWIGILLCVALAAVVISSARGAADDEVSDDTGATSPLAASRDLVATFGARLKTELKLSLDSGGPAVAIFVCKDSAPLIASSLSRRSGAKIKRTSLRYRNPANAPEPWEAEVLASAFGVAGKPDHRPHEFIVSLDDGATRYMQSIATAPICLVCHGQSVSKEVSALLDEHYPHDLARGYAPNDIRGAYSVTWPSGTRWPAHDRAATP